MPLPASILDLPFGGVRFYSVVELHSHDQAFGFILGIAANEMDFHGLGGDAASGLAVWSDTANLIGQEGAELAKGRYVSRRNAYDDWSAWFFRRSVVRNSSTQLARLF